MKSSTISRRRFLQKSGGIAIFIGASGLVKFSSCSRVDAATNLPNMALTAWAHLRGDGQITIYNPGAEMGQGAMTALPLMFAEEMDANWEDVTVEFSPQVASIYGSSWRPGGTKHMMTVGSHTTKAYFSIMRQAGAQARYVLLNSAAKLWEVPVEELTTKPGVVLHEQSGQEIGYGELVEHLAIPETLPEFPLEKLKSPDQFQLIGKDIPRNDIPEKTNGQAQFAIDVQLPNMLYGMVERGKVHNAKPTLINEAEILNMPGVKKIVSLEYGIGVIAESLMQAMAAKKALKIEWGAAKSSDLDSEAMYSRYEKIMNSRQEGRVLRSNGNFNLARRNSAKTFTIDFKNDYVYHAQMEPLNAVVQVAEDLQSAEVWVGSQNGPSDKNNVAKVLGIDPAKVTVHQCYLGGGLGRRSRGDYSQEAAELAKEVAPNPLKVIWTREDDLQYGMYRPLSLQRLIATTNANGDVTGLAHYIVGDGANLLASGIKNEFYDIPNQHQEVRIQEEGIRIKHWRAVGHGPNKFAIECMIEEIAMAQGEDSIAFRRKLMEKFPRALATLEKAAEMANWGSPLAEGRARGVAFLERSGTLSTGICEISVNNETGKIKVHHFWSAHDAGIVVQPDNAIAQIEGGIVMGIGSVLTERITIKKGEIQQSNFHDYHILRMEDTPESIETAFIASNKNPEGVGESGTPLVAGAIANAFARLTGKRLRHLPFTPERVKEVLRS